MKTLTGFYQVSPVTVCCYVGRFRDVKNSKLVSRCHVQYSSILETTNQLNSRSYSSTTRV